MEWPQIVWISVIAVSLLLNARDHGKPKEGKHNFFIGLVVLSIQLFLLIMGGFFNGK